MSRVKGATQTVLVLTMLMGFAGLNYAGDFGDIRFENGKFIYRGVSYATLQVEQRESMFLYDGKDVIEFAVNADKDAGMIIYIRKILKDKPYFIEFPVNKIKFIMTNRPEVLILVLL